MRCVYCGEEIKGAWTEEPVGYFWHWSCHAKAVEEARKKGKRWKEYLEEIISRYEKEVFKPGEARAKEIAKKLSEKLGVDVYPSYDVANDRWYLRVTKRVEIKGRVITPEHELSLEEAEKLISDIRFVPLLTIGVRSEIPPEHQFRLIAIASKYISPKTDFIVFDPEAKEMKYEDEGRTLRYPAPWLKEKVWAKLDDYGSPETLSKYIGFEVDTRYVVTFMLPHEY